MLFSRCGLTTASLEVITTSLNLPALVPLLKVQDADRILRQDTPLSNIQLTVQRIPKSFATDLTH